MNNENKGITLVALVITIIVLLILAGITISMTIGQKGILQKAQEAGKNYTNATNYEHEKLSDISEEVNNIIDSLTPKVPQISEEVKALQVGQYVQYDTGIEEVGNIICRVLYPVSSEYGLQIISDKCVENVTFGGKSWKEGKESYNGAIEQLNEATKKYVNPDYAYDGRCVGSIPTVKNGMFVDKDKFKDSEGNTPNTVFILDSWPIPSSFGGTRDTGCYDSDENYVQDLDALGTSMSNISMNYWLASRVMVHDKTGMNFCVRFMGSSLSNNQMCRVGSVAAIGISTYTRGLRPCISLKSYDIKIVEGDGTLSNPYVIGK